MVVVGRAGVGGERMRALPCPAPSYPGLCLSRGLGLLGRGDLPGVSGWKVQGEGSQLGVHKGA